MQIQRLNIIGIKGMCILLLSLFCLNGIKIFSQSTDEQCKIKGRIVDSADNKNMAFATLSLIKLPDNTVEQKLISNENGTFQISVKKGNYQLQIYSLGYKIKPLISIH